MANDLSFTVSAMRLGAFKKDLFWLDHLILVSRECECICIYLFRAEKTKQSKTNCIEVKEIDVQSEQKYCLHYLLLICLPSLIHYLNLCQWNWNVAEGSSLMFICLLCPWRKVQAHVFHGAPQSYPSCKLILIFFSRLFAFYFYLWIKIKLFF